MTDPERIKGLLAGMMSGLGVAAPMQSARLFSKWAEIVGADVAARARPVSLKDGLLRIKTDSAIWAAEFRYLAPEVIKRVNTELGAPLVKEIKVWVNPNKESGTGLTRGSKKPKAEPLEQPLERPSETTIRQVEKMVSAISDEGLSKAAKKALLAAKMHRRKAP